MENIINSLKNLTSAQLKELAVAIKEQAKLTKAVEKEQAKTEKQALGIKVTDTVSAKIGDAEVIGVVSNVTDNGVTIKVEGRDRALFRAWQYVGEVLETGAGLAPKPQAVDPALIVVGATATFTLKDKTYSGVVTKIGDKGPSVKFVTDEGKTRTLARPFSSVIAVAAVADEADLEVAM